MGSGFFSQFGVGKSEPKDDLADISKIRALRLQAMYKEVEEKKAELLQILSQKENELKTLNNQIEQQKRLLIYRREEIQKEENEFNARKQSLEARENNLKLAEKDYSLRKAELDEQKSVFESIRVDAKEIESITVAEAKRRLEQSIQEADRDAAIVRKQKLQEINSEVEGIRQQADSILKLSEEKQKELEAEFEKLSLEQKALAEERNNWEIVKTEERRLIEDDRLKRVELQKMEIEIKNQLSDIENQKEKIKEDSDRVNAAIEDMENGFIARRNALEMELIEKKNKTIALQNRFIDEQTAILKKDIDAARDRLRKELVEERQNQAAILSEEKNNFEVMIATRKAELEKEYSEKLSYLIKEREVLEREKGALNAQRNALQKDLGEFEQAQLQAKERQDREHQRLRERQNNIDAEVDDRVEDFRVSCLQEKQELKDQLKEVRSQLWTQEKLKANFEELEHRLGGRSAEAVIYELNMKTDEIRRLKEDLSTKPTEEVRERISQLESKLRDREMQISRLNDELQANSEPAAVTEQLKRENQTLRNQLDLESKQLESYKAWNAIADERYEKLRSDYEALCGTPADEDNRREQVETPFITQAAIASEKVPFDSNYRPNELEWLKGIYQACENYGLHFNRRLLYAFHTALKTAEWAPLTVLAGVSGTGKSELPRLYSHFGGLYFCPVAVQPNWDSQESMLGYFNSIDNHFDSTPLLNFLAQSQKTSEDNYPGLSAALNVVLLDEMNLAHPELYFADFLSKLELRRGQSKAQVPSIQVKLGAGIPAYRLPLRRNVIWIGTMNQDETTKSLSDKVLDRSIIINFPRPTELKRRPQLIALDPTTRGRTLPLACWNQWTKWKSEFTEKEIRPYKEYVETLNSCLGSVGRAIGHRVWQSVEYYMSNHPLVISASDMTAREKAMHMAFEDQLVQKVMPKIRGVETRGRAKTECLDKIRNLLVTGVEGKPFNLTEDFDLSCELGYGQFIWQSANYLQEESDKDD